MRSPRNRAMDHRMQKRRQIALAAGALSLAALGVAGPPALDLRTLTHRSGHNAPAGLQAALDLGLASASIMVTWTAARLVR